MSKVKVMLYRLPTLRDYKAVGLTSGTDENIKLFGDRLINVLFDQFDGKTVVEQNPYGINFECDQPGFEGAWLLPADLFTIK